MRSSIYPVTFFCLSVFSLVFSLAIAAETPMPLFAYQNKAVAAQPNAKSVLLNNAMKQAKVGQSINISLPDGKSLNLTVSEKQEMSNQTIVLQAANGDGVNMTLTIGRKATFGSISSEKVSYSIGFTPQTGQFLVNNLYRDAAAINLSNDMRFPPDFSQQKQRRSLQIETLPSNQEGAQDDKETQSGIGGIADMTLLVVYNPEFSAGFGDAQARIEQAIAFTNQALSSTGVSAQFLLAAAVEIDFSNSSTVGTLLTQSTNGIDAFSNLPALRNQFGADMVSVLSFRNDFAANGVAWVNGDNPNFAFSSTRLSPFCCDTVFAHELGHNLGSGHERDSANPTGDSCDDSFQPGGFTGFSCGHGVLGNFGTIMSRIRSNATSFNRFSNPSQNCNGLPCGIAQGQANAADNFTSFNTSAFLVEQFRANVNPIDPGPPDRPNEVIISPILPLLLDEED